MVYWVGRDGRVRNSAWQHHAAEDAVAAAQRDSRFARLQGLPKKFFVWPVKYVSGSHAHIYTGHWLPMRRAAFDRHVKYLKSIK